MTDTRDHAVPAGAVGERWSYRRALLGIAALALCLLFGLYLFAPDLIRAATADAYVEAHVEAISARVPGYVMALHVDDNTAVSRGDVLLELDARDYQVKADTEAANLMAAESRVDEARAQSVVAANEVDVAVAEAQAAQSNAWLATDDLKRFEGVSDIRAISTQRLDTARAGAQASQATLSAARTRVALAKAQLDVARTQQRTAEAAVAQARAALEQAQLELSYTHILAPDGGSVANKLVETGNYVQPGQTLLSVVPSAVYVIANFKETQIERIEPGSNATVRVDSLPDLTLSGHVESIQRGTGSQFALLPPENATGNFVKIVQRIPVKIVLDEPPSILARLAPGMSCEVSIRYSGIPAWLDFFD
jgi:membrane fusion protein (multidrug efflux system)